MISSGILATRATQGDQGAIPGHCNQCYRVWTLTEPQGVCQWCGKRATCQTATAKPRRERSRRRKREQNTGIGSGYDQLPEPHLTFYNVALPFAKSVPTQDGEDLLHTIIVNLADAARNGKPKPDNPSWMYRIASFTKAQYWRAHYKHTNGLDCGSCSKAQRRKCRKDWLYGNCPKAIKIESLNKPIIDSEGNLTELGNLIADDTALDIPQWLERNEQLLHSPDRLILIGEKIRDGETLTHGERTYLCKCRKREQKTLF